MCFASVAGSDTCEAAPVSAPATGGSRNQGALAQPYGCERGQIEKIKQNKKVRPLDYVSLFHRFLGEMGMGSLSSRCDDGERVAEGWFVVGRTSGRLQHPRAVGLPASPLPNPSNCINDDKHR